MSRRFILFVPRFPELDRIVGGIQLRPYELCHALASAGHRVEVWETRAPNGRPRVEHDGRLRVAPLDSQGRGVRGLAARLREMRRRLRAAGPGACFYQQAPSGFVLRRGVPFPVTFGAQLLPYARARGLVTWASVHDLSPEHESMLASVQPDRAAALRVIGAMQRLDARRLLPRASFVTATSHRQVDALRARYGLEPDRLGLYPPGVNPSLVASIPAWTPPAPGEPWRVGYLGSPRDVALGLLRSAIERAAEPRLRLVVAGVGMQEALGGASGVEVIDPARYADFGAVAARVDLWVAAYAHPYMPDYTWELKLPMTLASGRPLLRTDGAALPGSPWAPWLIPTGRDPERIAADLRAVMRAPQEAAERAARARAAMLAEYTWSAIIGRLTAQLDRAARRG